MSKAAPWSFSRIKAFEQCPKQFYHEKVLKQYPFKETDAMRYGTDFHKACEDYIGEGTPIPKKFDFIKPTLDALNRKPGKKIVEQKLGLTADLEPCSFFAKDVWFRGIVDLAIIDEETGVGWIIDYKTGKSAKYADKGQLELMALTIFKHYPKVTKLNAGLLFVIAKSLVKAEYEIDLQQLLWSKWLANYAKMEKAFEVDVWNPPSIGPLQTPLPSNRMPTQRSKLMPYTKKPRPYKKEYEQQKKRGEHEDRMERQKARRKMDKTGKDANKNGKADKREGKDIAHKKPLSKGGTNKDGVKIQSRKKNRAAGGAMSSPKKKR